MCNVVPKGIVNVGSINNFLVLDFVVGVCQFEVFKIAVERIALLRVRERLGQHQDFQVLDFACPHRYLNKVFKARKCENDTAKACEVRDR